MVILSLIPNMYYIHLKSLYFLEICVRSLLDKWWKLRGTSFISNLVTCMVLLFRVFWWFGGSQMILFHQMNIFRVFCTLLPQRMATPLKALNLCSL